MSNVHEIAEYLKSHHLSQVNANSSPAKPRQGWYARHGKRIADLAIAIPASVVLLPVNALLAIATAIDVGRPIMFKQTRCGMNEKPFVLFKFRNMTNDTGENGELLPASQRVTKWGRFVRSASLDELLNFYSILIGDMSVIGPRPFPVEFNERLSERHKARTSVRPGLECPPLQKGAKRQGYDDQLENDIAYVERMSFAMDVRLFFTLFGMVFDRKTRKFHANVGGGDFVGYDENGHAINMRTALERGYVKADKNDL